MSSKSNIEWTDATWNPMRGCTKISPGCKHCYAETFAERFRGVPDHPFEQGFDFRLVPSKLAEPLLWPAPRTVFVNSMSDLFLDEVPDEYIRLVAHVMALSPWHTYQVLTKRGDRMAQLLGTSLRDLALVPNVWWGVSVEDRRFGVPRVDRFRYSPAALRFLSIEPLLEDIGQISLEGIHWVIVGGESGPGARPMRAEWVRSIHAQCRAAGVPFFFKQWGGVQKSRAGRELDGRTYDEMPKRVPIAMPDRATRINLAAKIDQLAEKWVGRPSTLPAEQGELSIAVRSGQFSAERETQS
jgi:protein gp37